MTITELQQQYAAHPNMAVMKRLLKDTSVQTVFCGGLYASAASLFSSVLVQEGGCPFVFILGDLEEAGYFYHDLTQILGSETVLFFPSSFRRSIKYGQKDAANEILRTEVLSRLQKGEKGLCIVTYPDALAEKVVSRKELSNKTLKLSVGEKVDTTFITDVLHSYGFEYVDYVYEPGQYAVRGSIIDVFSFASEYPYRIDFFGDEVESVRTFEVESQLSREKKKEVSIVPDLAVTGEVTTSFLDFIPKETVLAMRDFLWLRERIQVVHDEALTPQAIAVQEAEENGGITLEGKLIDGSEFTVRALDFRRLEFGNKPTGTPEASVSFSTSAQPIFHKNFDLVASSFKDYLDEGRCYELSGHEGAYNLYNIEARLDKIVTQLDAVISNLSEIKYNQYSLYQAVKESGERTNLYYRQWVRSTNDFVDSYNNNTNITNYRLQRMNKELEYQNKLLRSRYSYL